MRNKLLIGLLVIICLAGCATTETQTGKKSVADYKAEIAELKARINENEQALDSIQAQLDKMEQEQTSPTSIKMTPKGIQQALKNAGYYEGAIDGKIGPMTQKAVKEFQADNGLKVDGVVGKQTWAKLTEYLK